MDNPETRNETKTNKQIIATTKTTQEKQRSPTQVLGKGKQLMILIKHPSVLIALYLDIFTSGKSRDYKNIPTANIRKLCGLEPNDVMIEQEFNFIGKESYYYTGKKMDI